MSTQLAYMAGLFDGEGSVDFKRRLQKRKNKPKAYWYQYITCEMAGRSHAYVREKIRKKVLRDNGWNVDTKIRISSPRRTKQMRNINKKHLTGNAYYAAKKQAAALSQSAN